MDLAFITPTTYLRKFASQGDIYLALAHLIDDDGQNDYACFHRGEAEKGRRVILDNGLFEGAQVGTEALLRRAQAIGAQVVCAPDILYDSAGTIKEFKNFIRAKQDAGLSIDVMGIPQADNPADFWDCFRFMDLSGDCQLIGLSILSVPHSFGELVGNRGITASRLYLLEQLSNYEKLAGRPATKCHLLGLGESLADIMYAARELPHTVISNDSSSAFVHGMNNVAYSVLGTWPGGKIEEKLDFQLPALMEFHKDSQYLESLIQRNIDKAKALAHAPWR